MSEAGLFVREDRRRVYGHEDLEDVVTELAQAADGEQRPHAAITQGTQQVAAGARLSLIARK